MCYTTGCGYLAASDDLFRGQTLPYVQLHMYGQQIIAMMHCIHTGTDTGTAVHVKAGPQNPN